MKKFLLVLSCWSALLPLGKASPITLFDTITGIPTAGTSALDQPGYFSAIFSSFSTLNQPVILENVKLKLGPDGGDTGMLTISLWADTGDPLNPAPTGQLAPLGTINDVTISSLGVYNFPGSFLLQANTRYWIDVSALGGANSASSEWAYNFNNMTGTVGATGEYNYDAYDGAYSIAGGGAYQLTVNGDTVPEPATILLGALGLGALAFLRRRSAV